MTPADSLQEQCVWCKLIGPKLAAATHTRMVEGESVVGGGENEPDPLNFFPPEKRFEAVAVARATAWNRGFARASQIDSTSTPPAGFKRVQVGDPSRHATPGQAVRFHRRRVRMPVSIVATILTARTLRAECERRRLFASTGSAWQRIRDVARRGRTSGLRVAPAAAAVLSALQSIRLSIAVRERVRTVANELVARRAMLPAGLWRARTIPWTAVCFGSGVVVGALAMYWFGIGLAQTVTQPLATVGSASIVSTEPSIAEPSAPLRPVATTTLAGATGERVNSPRSGKTTGAPPPAAAPGYRGALTIHSQPAGATVIVNTRRVGETPITLSALPAGSRAVRIELAGYTPWSRAVRVVANQSTRIDASLDPAR